MKRSQIKVVITLIAIVVAVWAAVRVWHVFADANLVHDPGGIVFVTAILVALWLYQAAA